MPALSISVLHDGFGQHPVRSPDRTASSCQVRDACNLRIDLAVSVLAPWMNREIGQSLVAMSKTHDSGHSRERLVGTQWILKLASVRDCNGPKKVPLSSLTAKPVMTGPIKTGSIHIQWTCARACMHDPSYWIQSRNVMCLPTQNARRQTLLLKNCNLL